MSAPGRQRYGAVMGVVVFLAVINGIAAIARKWIPPAEPNPELMGRGDFLERGAHQMVRWEPATTDALAAARRAGKPILLVAGSRVSPLARAFDDRVFDSTEVAERLNREFTPLRVDVLSQPEWRAFFLPFTKLRLGADLYFDVVVLDTTGRLVSHAQMNPRSAKADEAAFQDFLTDALKRVREPNRGLDAEQDTEISLLSSPNVRELPESIRGQSLDDGLEVMPWNLRVRLALGMKGDAEQRVDRLLAGPAYDWQGWGFFSRSLNESGTQVAPVKEAPRTHDMGILFARLGASTGRSDLLMMARRCLDRAGFYRTGFTELIDVFADGRIENKSVPVSFLREGIDPELRQDAIDLWRLDPGVTPQMLPHPKSLAEFDRDPAPYNRAMNAIMRRSPQKPEALMVEEAWFAGMATARMTEGAALLRDPGLAEKADREWDRLQSFRSGKDEVIRNGSQSFPGNLADYLGYAEAAYWRWTAVGDSQALAQGQAVMDRAWFLFANDQDGTLSASGQSGPLLGNFRPNLPLWFDADRASDPARMAMLWMGYGRVLENERYIDRARKVMLRYGSYANVVPNRSGAMFLAVQQLQGSATFHVAGSDAARLWRAWTISRPAALVVRAAGDRLKPGVWRNAGGETVKMPDDPGLAIKPLAGTTPNGEEPGP